MRKLVSRNLLCPSVPLGVLFSMLLLFMAVHAKEYYMLVAFCFIAIPIYTAYSSLLSFKHSVLCLPSY